MGMRWFFNDLQFLSAMSGGSGSTLLIRSFESITSLWSSATHCLSGGLQGLCVTTMGGRLLPSLTLYVNVSLLGVTRALSDGLFQGFYVIASREQGGLNFLGTFFKRSRVRTKPSHSEELARRNVLVYMRWMVRPPM